MYVFFGTHSKTKDTKSFPVVYIKEIGIDLSWSLPQGISENIQQNFLILLNKINQTL